MTGASRFLLLRRNWLPPLHRGYSGRLHRARWVRSDAYVRNPWWNIRWLMEALDCAVCGDQRLRILADRGMEPRL